jgi:hypothetical protein
MRKLLEILGVVALVASPINHASAALVSEDIMVAYINNSTTTFTLSDFSFASTSSGNLLAGLVGGTFGAGTFGTLFNEVATLDTSKSYTFAFNASFPAGGGFAGGSFVGGASLIPTGDGTQNIGSFSSPGGMTLYASSITLSAVPLPSSFPLFVMALIGLGMFGYHSVRQKQAANAAVAA